MSYPLNNFTTQDTYVATSEVVVNPPRKQIAMIVTNAAIYYKTAPNVPGTPPLGSSYTPEVYAIPGRYTFDETDFVPSGMVSLINVRSAVVGTPAQVTIV